jgi:hypothetical protein
MNADCPRCGATLYLPSIGVCYCYCGQRVVVNISNVHKDITMLGYPSIRVEIETRGDDDDMHYKDVK